MIRAMDDESRGFVIDEDVIISIEYPLGLEFLVDYFGLCLTLFPDFEDSWFDIYMEDITSSELRIFWEFFSREGDFLGTQSLIYFSELCSGKYFPHISIESLTEIVC